MKQTKQNGLRREVWLPYPLPRLQGMSQRKETVVNKGNPNDETGSRRDKSPLASAAMLLGIYVAMYLAAAALIRVLVPLDTFSVSAVAAAAQVQQAAPSPVATADDPAASDADGSATTMAGDDPARTNGSHECTSPPAATD
jgi:hypothetical protein